MRPSWREARAKAPTIASAPSALRTARTWRAPSVEVDAVEAEAGDEAEVVGDDERHVAGVADRAQRVGGAGDVVLGGGGEREADAGDLGRVEEGGDPVGQAGLEGRRGDQVEPGGTGILGHRAGQRLRIERPA